jgi:hypothetical protein
VWEAQESPLLEAIAKKLETMQDGKDLIGAVVIRKVWGLVIAP